MTAPAFSRRDLLKTATAAGVVLAASPLARGSDASTLRWGIIGTGTRGAFTHIPVLKNAPESQVVALCDVSEQRLAAAAAKVGHPVATCADHQKLLANPDVNAVVIAVPNLLHREILLASIAAGKHVLCEKPAGTTPAEAAAMKQAVDSAKTVVMFGMQYRNNVRPKKIAELIAAGEIGKPKYIVQNCARGDWNTSPNVWQYADPKLGGKPMNWRFSHTATGGSLNEYDCHYFDLLHWFTGSLPQRISCEGGIAVYHDGRDTWDHATVTLRYPGDVTAVHTLCLYGPGRNDLTITGDEGAIESIANSPLKLFRFTKHEAGGARIREVKDTNAPARPGDRATLALYEDFLTCVKTGKKPEAHVDRAVAACKTCWLSELAADQKSEVTWTDLTA
jgi:predicted dehydrogenase